ncbi:hypothetical protein LCGC14_2337140 [marine sediment metagenome]|uniref:Uncharacterized protein n=1 Tax=marine sediment metagenome TaxID=412755 RepID=A0A0F9F879_9ZZZZ
MPTEKRKKQRERNLIKLGIHARDMEHELRGLLQLSTNKLSALRVELEEAQTAKAELHGEIAIREAKWYRREREHEDKVRELCQKALTDINELATAHHKEVSALENKVSALDKEIRAEGTRSLRRRLQEKGEALDLANAKCRGYEKRIRMMLNSGF